TKTCLGNSTWLQNRPLLFLNAFPSRKMEFDEEKGSDIYFLPNQKGLKWSNQRGGYKYKVSTVIPATDINKFNGKAIELAHVQYNFEAVRLLLSTHVIIHSYEKASPDTYEIATYKRIDLSHINYSEVDVFINNTLELTSECDRLELAKLVLRNGTEIHAKNDYTFRRASYDGNLETVKLLLDHDYGVGFHADNYKALIDASSRTNGHVEIVKLILNLDADIHARNNQALKRDVSCFKFELAEYLVVHRADVSSDRNSLFKLSYVLGNLEKAKHILDVMKTAIDAPSALVFGIREFGGRSINSDNMWMYRFIESTLNDFEKS
ncbi:hypothetical protein BB560_004724, partial [Smittium megazygosporum]